MEEIAISDRFLFILLELVEEERKERQTEKQQKHQAEVTKS